MRSEWRQLKLSEVADITSSKRIYAREYVAQGVPFYRSKEIIEKAHNQAVSTPLYISKQRFDELDSVYGSPRKGDILLTSVGTLGVPYLVRDEKFYFKDGNLTWFKVRNGIDAKFLYYWFLSPDAVNQIDARHIGSTQKALPIDTLNKFKISLPPLSSQRAIADTLACLDAKMESNNRVNENLEAQAQAIFKSWFVDFEPFQNGEFVESELGLIPKGWEVEKLGTVVAVKYGKDHKPLADGSIPVYGSGGLMRHVDTALYERETVLIPRKGTLDNVTLINHPFWSVDTMFYTELKIPDFAKFLYHMLLTKNLAAMNVGSAVPSMTVALLNEIKFVMPSAAILEEFENVTGALHNAIPANEKQNKVLASLRDTLLPELMSGEIEVPLD